MKKKILSVLLALCLLCTGFLMTSCDKAEDIFEEAYKNTEALDSFAAEIEMNISMKMNGQTYTIPMTIDMKIKDAKSDNPTMFADYSMSVMGESMEAEMYLEDGWLYMVSESLPYDGVKMNAATAGDDYDFNDDMDDIVQDIPEEFFKDIKPVKNKDGSKTITIEFSDEDFSEIYGDIIDSVKESADLGDVDDVYIEDAVVVITIKDDYISVYEMNFSMGMTIGSETVTADVEMTATYSDYGDVSIKAPEGYQNFVDISDYN